MDDRERIDPEAAGFEGQDPTFFMPREPIKNLYCPIDEHYCEQPSCENCQFEATLE